MTTRGLATRHLVVASIAVVVLAAGSTVGLAAASGAFRQAATAPNGRCSAPALPGTIVDVTLADMGPMMSGWGGGMRVTMDKGSVPAGPVSLRVANTGTRVHELVVLPLPDGQRVGQRFVGADRRIDESGSVAEASRTCGAGAGEGIDPGGMSWTTVTLARGNYELVCNMPRHYAAGMHTKLVVS